MYVYTYIIYTYIHTGRASAWPPRPPFPPQVRLTKVEADLRAVSEESGRLKRPRARAPFKRGLKRLI